MTFISSPQPNFNLMMNVLLSLLVTICLRGPLQKSFWGTPSSVSPPPEVMWWPYVILSQPWAAQVTGRHPLIKSLGWKMSIVDNF